MIATLLDFPIQISPFVPHKYDKDIPDLGIEAGDLFVVRMNGRLVMNQDTFDLIRHSAEIVSCGDTGDVVQMGQ